MLSDSTVQNLGSALSSTACRYGVDLTPKAATLMVNSVSVTFGNAYRTLTDYIPGLPGYINMASSFIFGEPEQKALTEYSVNSVEVEPLMKEEVITEEQDTDDEFQDCLPEEYFTTPKVSVEQEQKATAVNTQDTDITTVEKTPAAVVQSKSSSKKNNGSDVAFGTHIPKAKSRKKGMTDAEYMQKFQQNIRLMEDPLAPGAPGKPRGKARKSAAIDRLAQPKVRAPDLHISHYEAEMRFRKSLRNGKV